MGKSVTRALVVALSLLLTAVALVVPAASAQGQSGTVSLEWLGHNAWRATSPSGKII